MQSFILLLHCIFKGHSGHLTQVCSLLIKMRLKVSSFWKRPVNAQTHVMHVFTDLNNSSSRLASPTLLCVMIQRQFHVFTVLLPCIYFLSPFLTSLLPHVLLPLMVRSLPGVIHLCPLVFPLFSPLTSFPLSSCSSCVSCSHRHFVFNPSFVPNPILYQRQFT